MADQKKNILDPFNEASDELKMVIKRVLQAEKDKLYLSRPQILDDIVRIIKEEIK
jgi:hypothetical protein